ncbi:hypothetical protein [Nisaea sp.]|uniref:hypothetical protein n=1 Tax=Nisaea sp. TaxID=2024842 RepID=UPI0032ECFCF9
MQNLFRCGRTACLVAAMAVGGMMPPAPAAAGRISPEMTNPRHLSRAPEQHKWRMKRVTVPKSTIYENPKKRGLLFKDNRPLYEVADLDRQATKACRGGQFRRYGGGFVRVGGETYRAARARDIRGSLEMDIYPGIYVFKHEGTTRCTVFLAENR